MLAVSPAAALTKGEIQSAIEQVDVESLKECVESTGSSLTYDTEVRDLNADGADEIVLGVGTDMAGQGSSGCFGRSTREMFLLIQKGSGWDVNFGFDAHSLSYIERPGSAWPDIEIGGPGMCFPIWRMHDESYGIWKTCEEGKLVFAEGLRPDAVPAGDEAMVIPVKAPAVDGPRIVDVDTLDGTIIFDHNGSGMFIDTEKGLIVYEMPKASIARTVSPGQVLFHGTFAEGGPVSGTAYTFKKGCAPAPYKVSGDYVETDGMPILILKGAAPRRAKSGCAITGYSTNSANALLKFTFLVSP